MNRWLGLSFLTAAFALAPAAAAAPQLRLQVDQNGDFLLIGNTLGHECAAGTPAPLVGTVGNCGTNTADSSPDIFWRSESPGAGQAQANNTITLAQARSTAVLTVPPGATVSHAFLYWAGNQAGGDNTATFDRPGGFSQNLTALQVYTAANNTYQSVADVTSLVQANGSGAYRVSGVTTTDFVNANDNNIFGGWWLVVFYELASDPPRNLALFDGLDTVSNGNPQTANLTGFLVPPVFSNAKLAVITFEGDNSILGDQFFFDGTLLSNALNPATNFFNGTRSFLGAPVSVAGDLPRLTGGAQSMSGMDLDIVDVTSELVAGQTTAPIQATSTGDVYHLAGFITSIPTFRPDFSTSEKTAVDLNGGSLVAGDTIEYTIVSTNTGNDTAVNVVLTDALPTGVTYVPGSMQITAGPNSGAKTDPTGDDQCDYDGPSRTVTCRLGVGANASQGGQLAIAASSTIVFRVTVDAGAVGTISNQGVINAGGLLGSPPEDTPTDGNGNGNGSPPTDVVVDQCLSDSDCSNPTPHCDTTQSPKICVECLQDAHCPGNLPTCDLASNTCVCIPSGAEICDGLDNDCNGTIDDGFNVGQTCTNGVGECVATGAIICDGGGNAICDAVPGSPSNEVCDGLDNNCDGTADDGNPGSGAACSSGLPGICGPGLTDCQGGALACVAIIQPGTQTETCDGSDEDCDGTSDNGNPGGGVSCSSGLPGICDAGTTNCQNGAVECVANVQPGTQTETCDGSDEDCDGTVDDGFNLGQVCTVGVGECEASGGLICDGQGGTTCDAVPGQPTTEQCNDNLDSDCDGDPNNGCGTDSDGDGLTDDEENQIGTDPNDADSDDDGVPDGDEIDVGEDSDGDGLINGLDPDSDNDGLFDGTEMGYDCSNPDTDVNAGNCIPDGDGGATTTDPLDADTDDGGVSDGSEDINLNGVIDGNETDPNDGSDDNTVLDSDGDGLSDDLENQIGTDPFDADSDDDGVIDGLEPNPAADSDGDGLINALDPDSDDDGIFDGTEMGFDCSNPDTDLDAGNCVPDGDGGATTTSPVNPDTDYGGVPDGTEDSNHNGVIDEGETDPNDPADDVVQECEVDADCGGPSSGMVCDDTSHCVEGCRGEGGNGCPDGEICSSSDDTIGVCSGGEGGSGPGGGGPTDQPAGGLVAEGGACGCRAAPSGSGRGAALTALALALALSRRRRRRRHAG